MLHAAHKQQIDREGLFKEEELREIVEGSRLSKIKSEQDVHEVKNRVIIIVRS